MRLLLQCTIPDVDDDWHVERFALLAGELRKIANVVARNLEPSSTGDDPVLSRLSRGDFDEVWLLGVDGGRATALSPQPDPDRQRPDDLGAQEGRARQSQTAKHFRRGVALAHGCNESRTLNQVRREPRI